MRGRRHLGGIEDVAAALHSAAKEKGHRKRCIEMRWETSPLRRVRVPTVGLLWNPYSNTSIDFAKR